MSELKPNAFEDAHKILKGWNELKTENFPNFSVAIMLFKRDPHEVLRGVGVQKQVDIDQKQRNFLILQLLYIWW